MENLVYLKSQKFKSSIDKIFLNPKDVKPLKDVIASIYDADIIIMGPGSLYTV